MFNGQLIPSMSSENVQVVVYDVVYRTRYKCRFCNEEPETYGARLNSDAKRSSLEELSGMLATPLTLFHQHQNRRLDGFWKIRPRFHKSPRSGGSSVAFSVAVGGREGSFDVEA